MIRITYTLVLAVAFIALAQADKKKACGSAKASINSKRSIISNGDLNVDVSALSGGVKRRRSTPEEHEEDCDNAKKSMVEIKQTAVSAVPGRNEESTTTTTISSSEKNEKKSKVKDSHDYLMLPGKEADSNNIDLQRKDKLEKPNKRHSPLWSLSKLIENVDTKGAKKATVVVKPIKHEKAASKSNFATATDPSNAIKATLSKAIEKVEKVIAVKNAKEIAPAKAVVRSASKPTSSVANGKEQHQAPTSQTKSSSATTGKPSSTSTQSSIGGGSGAEKAAGIAHAAEKVTVKDPYAEIALGPDRPKIPELKSDAGDASPVMKMQGGEMKPVNNLLSSDPAARNAKPLAGEHDVGGLLDRLTDKLNSGGGGVALETSPLPSETNDVKYVQSQLSDDSGFKQAQEFAVDKLKDQADMSDMKKMTESDGLYSEGNDNNQQSLQNAAAAATGASPSSPNSAASPSTTDDLAASLEKAGAGQFSSPTPSDDLAASLEKANAAAASPASSEATETSDAAAALAGATGGNEETTGDDGVAKSFSKASSLSTDAVMDLLKSGKVPGTDFSNADVSPGPDPYENTAEAQQSTATTDDSLGSFLSGSSKESESNDDLAGSLAGELESSNSQLAGGSLGQMLDSSNMEGSDALSSRSPQQQETRESDEDFQRNAIPDREDNFRRSYNTEIFKKHVIMRPKRDIYVSPFHNKEAFDTAI